MNNQAIIRFSHVSEIDDKISPEIGRVTGLINAENFSKLMGVMGIDSNPRKPKESSVTKEIVETLEVSPELFHFMSKGILVSASYCETLERNRYKLDFEHNGFAQPGILDGGHNTYAIAKFLLSFALDSQELRKIKSWEDLIEAWKSNSDGLEDLFSSKSSESESIDFLIPLEIIFPRNNKDKQALKNWGESHRDITHARNNNAQLKDSTQANHQGFFDFLKDSLPVEVRNKIEWKTNDGGSIKAADIAALALIPLSALPEEKTGVKIDPIKIYNSKQYCVETYQKILEKDGHGTWHGVRYELKDVEIKSALMLVGDIVEAYDVIYQTFPDAYNKAGGSFGAIDGVKKRPCLSKYHELECEYQYADGFIIPIIASLNNLMEYKKGKGVSWKVVPTKFLKTSFPKILTMYYMVIKLAKFNPQKVGKEAGGYEFVSGAIQMALKD